MSIQPSGANTPPATNGQCPGYTAAKGRLLLDFERETAASASRSFFVTDAEVALFNRLAPECAVRVDAVCNGVDSDFFAPDDAFTSPYAADEVPIVFTGAMDYHPNADAAQWFAKEVMPLVTARTAKARFYVVGRSPGPEVLALQGEHVAVSGTVPMSAPTCNMPRLWSPPCASPAASGRRSSKRWPWRRR